MAHRGASFHAPENTKAAFLKAYGLKADGIETDLQLTADGEIVVHHNYFIDILLFNYKMNAFVVVELKLRSLRKEDKAQMEFYMKLVDEQVKEAYHNKTIGIIISKESDEFIVNFVRQDDIIPLSYEIEQVMLN